MSWMQQLQQYNQYIIYVLSVLLLISLLLQLLTWKKLNKLQYKYKKLTRGIDNKNLEELLLIINEQTDATGKQLAVIHKEQQQILDKLKTCTTTPKLLRYNAFDDMGSKLSFSLCLMDEEKNGVIITNIQGRDESRIYAKSIVKGQCSQHLSPEEKQILSTNQNPGL